jgi:ferric-dicitrate binding protein FerR (iron transport regulator)
VQSTILKPGHQASFSADNQLEVEKVDARTAASWIDGAYYFEKAPLAKVLDELCRWYNVKVVYKNLSKSDVAITGSFDRKNPLAKTLDELKFIGGDVDFKLENRTIIVL